MDKAENLKNLNPDKKSPKSESKIQIRQNAKKNSKGFDIKYCDGNVSNSDFDYRDGPSI